MPPLEKEKYYIAENKEDLIVALESW